MDGVSKSDGSLMPVEEYTSVGEVLHLIKSKMKPKRVTETVAVAKAYGRVAALDVSAPGDFPGSSMSHMDGYAVRWEDLRSATTGSPVVLRNRGALGPGAKGGNSISQGETIRVSTGAPVPAGADTVIPVERVTARGHRVTFDFVPDVGSFVYPKGGDFRKGETVVRRGQTIRAQDVGVLLMLGLGKVGVFAQPKVTVLATGSELTNERPGPGRVKNSHSPVFLGLVEELGCLPVDGGIARDRPVEILRKLRAALRNSEFVITLGGTSVGRHDAVGEAISKLIPDTMVHGIKMDRGRVAGVALAGGKPILMAPGPIQGAMNAFFLFAIPIIRELTGRTEDLPRIMCTLGADWNARRRFANFTKVVYVKVRDDGRVAVPIAGDTESFAVLTKANGFVIVPEEVESVAMGSEVEVSLLPGFSFA